MTEITTIMVALMVGAVVGCIIWFAILAMGVATVRIFVWMLDKAFRTR